MDDGIVKWYTMGIMLEVQLITGLASSIKACLAEEEQHPIELGRLASSLITPGIYIPER